MIDYFILNVPPPSPKPAAPAQDIFPVTSAYFPVPQYALRPPEALPGFFGHL